jgi:hypothetical protein
LIKVLDNKPEIIEGSIIAPLTITDFYQRIADAATEYEENTLFREKGWGCRITVNYDPVYHYPVHCFINSVSPNGGATIGGWEDYEIKSSKRLD